MKTWAFCLPLLGACSTPYPCVELGGEPAPGGGCLYDDDPDAGSMQDAPFPTEAGDDAGPMDSGADAIVSDAEAGIDGG